MVNKVYFQIGTNVGNDKFSRMVKETKPDIIILVEPNELLIQTIKDNYTSIDNVYIYNNAVYYKDDEPVELFLPAKNGIYGTKAVNNHTYTHGQFSLLPMNDWGDKSDMIKITTKGITFDTICANHNITEIEYLQIDTEGFDSEIIKMIDLSKYKIHAIRFEKWEFESYRFTNYNKEKAEELGINGMNHTIDKLQKHNYTLHNISDEDGNDIIAILK